MSQFSLLLVMVCLLAVPTAVSAGNSPTGTMLYTVDLDTGNVVEAGSLKDKITGFALYAPSDDVDYAVATTATGEVIAFNVVTPNVIDARATVTGLNDGARLVGIDFRPATGDLIGLSDDGVLYSVDFRSGIATALGSTLDPQLEDSILGFDFNPTVDRIRVDVSATQNLRLNPETGTVGTNPDTGAPTIDGNTAFAPDDMNADVTPRVVGAGYTNNVDGAESTSLYVIDAETGSLALQDPPNDGVLNTVGPLGIDISDGTAFDIAPTGEAYLAVPNGSDART